MGTQDGEGMEPPHGKPQHREHVILRAFGEEWVAYDGATQKLHLLNPTAAAVLHLCDGTMTAAEIAVAVAEAFDAQSEIDRVRADVAEALERLRTEELLLDSDPDANPGATS